MSIKKKKSISSVSVQILELLPKLFYSSTSHKYLFSDAFEILQLLIYYGGSFLSSNQQYIKNIILMANDSINSGGELEKKKF